MNGARQQFRLRCTEPAAVLVTPIRFVAASVRCAPIVSGGSDSRPASRCAMTISTRRNL